MRIIQPSQNLRKRSPSISSPIRNDWRRTIHHRKLSLEPLEDRRLLSFGSALALDGMDDYATVADNASLDLGIGATEDLTIEARFFVPDLNDEGLKTLIYKQGAYALFANFHTSQPDQFFFRIWNGGTYCTIYSAPSDLSVGWHHAAAVFDNEWTASQDMAAVFLDGSRTGVINSIDFVPGIDNSYAPLNTGAYSGTNPFHGWIDEVRLSNVVRYGSASYTVPTAPFASDANTRALWHFDETPGSTSFADSSPYGNTLIGVNGAHTSDPVGDTTPPTVSDVLDVAPDPRNAPVNVVYVVFSETIDRTTFTFEDLSLTCNDSPVTLSGAVSTNLVSGVTYGIFGLASFTSSDGDYVLTVDATGVRDLAGNAGIGSASDAWTMINLTPAPSAPDLVDVSDCGISSTDDLTNLDNSESGKELLFTVGNTIAGSTVTVYADGIPIGTAVATSDTTTVTTNGTHDLEDGIRAITARQTLPGHSQSSDSDALGITIDTVPSIVADVVDVAPDPHNTAVDTVDVVFSEPINLSTFTFEDVTLTRDSSPVTLTSAVTTSLVSGTTYRISGLSSFTSIDGDYVLTVDASAIQDLAGNTGTGSGSDSWTMMTITPAPSAPDLVDAFDSGISDTDDLTNLDNSEAGKELQFTVGNTIAGATVTLYADGSVIGNAVATGDVTVITTDGTNDLEDGTHVITARQELSGISQSAESESMVITIDTSALFPAQWLGEYRDVASNISAVSVYGTIAYVSDECHGLRIVDVSDPTAPVELGDCEISGIAHAVVVSGTVAYVAAGPAGLHIIDVTDPAVPVWLGCYDTGGDAWGIAVSGTVAYVADESCGLQIIDVTDPTAPIWLSEYDTSGEAMGVTVSGTLAYVADGRSGLQIIDVSEPGSPVWQGGYDTSGYAWSTVISETLIYVADDGAGLQIIDVSDPAAPVWLGGCYATNRTLSVAVVETTAYVADDGGGLQVIDVSNLSAPERIGRYETDAYAKGLVVSGTLAFIAYDFYGLQVIDVANPALPVRLGGCDISGTAEDVVVSGTVAYLADSDAGLQIIDVSNPAEPVRLGGYDTDNYALSVHVSESVAYVLDVYAGLYIIDVSNPTTPVCLGRYDTGDSASSVTVSESLAFVTDLNAGLQIIDVSDPAVPIRLGSYDTTEYATSVAVSGTVAYLTDSNAGLQIIDVIDPTAPVRLGGYDTSGQASGVAVVGTVAYVADGDAGLQIIDVSDPTAPVWLGGYDTSGQASGVAVSGMLACLADHTAGLQIINVSNPAAPKYLGEYDTGDFSLGVAISELIAYVACGFDGLQVISCRVTGVTPDLQGSCDTGISNSDDITGDNTPTFEVIRPLDSYFRFYRDGVQISGDYETGDTYTTAFQTDGIYNYTVVAVDAAGNVTDPSSSIEVTIDTAQPTIIDVLDVTPDPRNSSADTIDVVFSEEIDPSTFTFEDISLTRDSSPVTLTGAVTTSLVSGTTYRISGLSSFTATHGDYVLTVNASGIQDLAGNAGTGSGVDSWMLDTTLPTVTDVLDVTPDPRSTAVDTVDVVFSEPINLSTFTFEDLSLALNSSPVTLTGAVTTSLVSGTTYRISGLSSFTSTDGEYLITVNASGIQDLASNAGVGSRSDSWMMNTTPPTVTDVVDITPDPRNTTVDTVDVVFSEPINLSTFTFEDLSLTHDSSPVTLTGAITTSLVSGTTYRISGLSSFTSTDGNYALTVNASGIQDLASNAGVGSRSDSWTMNTTPPTVTDVVDITPDPRNTAVDTVDVVFSEPINLSTFTFEDVILTHDSSPVTLTGAITTSLVSGTTYRISGLSSFTSINGDYVLTVDASGIQDLAGNSGTGSASDTWTMNSSIDMSVLRVDTNAAPGGDGLAWITAYNNLQEALALATTLNGDGNSANDVHQIWIAEGTYKPTTELEPGDPRSASFSLVNGVTLYGGFVGTETTLDHRNWSAHITTLSGDLGTSGDNSDNTHTVVYCGAGIEARVNGISIIGGNANGSNISNHPERLYGGGIYNSGTLTVTNSMLSDNSAADGGGIYSCSGTLVVMDSTLANNSAAGSSYGLGGGIYSCSSTLMVTNSILSGNLGSYGGGIASDGTLIITNSTLSANLAGSYGGGIYIKSGSSIATLNNTIVAGNGAQSEYGLDIRLASGTLSGSCNLIGDGSGQSTLIHGIDGNQVGNFSSPIDPMLSDWTELVNGQWGYYLLPGSPAIDAGENILAVDTVGQPLAEDIYGNSRIQNGTVDIGAVEGAMVGSPAQIYVVGSLAKTISEDGVLTFAEAFQAANRNQPVGDAPAGSFGEQDVIQFAEGLNGTILVNDHELVIEGDLGIEGLGAKLLSFNAEGENRVFRIRVGAAVLLSGVTITGGLADEGGGIYNSGSLTVVNSALSGNSAYREGGAICSFGSSSMLMVVNSTLSYNSAAGSGGGIFNYGTMTVACSTLTDNSAKGFYYSYGGGICNNGTLTVTNSMLLGNLVSSYSGVGIYSYGGGICSWGTLTVTNSTLLGNSASGSSYSYGGGICCAGSSTTTLNNTIVAANTAPTGPNVCRVSVSGTLSGSYNLIGDGSGQSALVDGVDGNQVGTSAAPIDPMLSEMYRPLPGSPVIEAGSNELAVDAQGTPLAVDLDGNPRISGPSVDIGAYEYQWTANAITGQAWNDEDQDGAWDEGELGLEGWTVGISRPGGLGRLLTTIQKPVPVEGDQFGLSVAGVGERILVGAHRDDQGASNAGAAYLFDAVTGDVVLSFVNPEPDENDYFGQRVASLGDDVLIAAYMGDTGAQDAGSAYLFDGTTGGLLQTFERPTAAAYDYFGGALAGQGDWVLVGAVGVDTTAADAGAAYLFNATTGDLVRTFENPAPSSTGFFGASLAWVGDDVLIGAPSNDANASHAGAAYLFDAETGALLQTFLDPTPGANGWFGNAVAAVGGNVLVGTRYGEAAYLFDSTTGALLQTFVNPQPTTNDWFGFSLAAVGDDVLIGAYGTDGENADVGAAYLFDSSTGQLLRTFQNPDPTPSACFGYSVASVGNQVLIGALHSDLGAADAGAAYLFDAEFEAIATTGANGSYVFEGLEPGAYTVSEVMQNGWEQTYPTGTAAHSVTLGEGDIVSGIHFGNHELPKLPGDANRSGTVDADDARILASHWLWDEDVSWDDGDFNGDGRVDDLDASILAANWGNSVTEGSGPTEPQTPAVVEGARLIGPRRLETAGLVAPARTALGLAARAQAPVEAAGMVQVSPGTPVRAELRATAHDVALAELFGRSTGWESTAARRKIGPVARPVVDLAMMER